jgi:hypothetical protein
VKWTGTVSHLAKHISSTVRDTWSCNEVIRQ